MERAHHLPMSRSPRPDRDGARRTPAGVALRIRAWLRRRRLDSQLAAGASPSTPSTPIMRLRARRLIGRRMREVVAVSIEGAVSRAEHGNPSVSAAVPVNVTAVQEARPLLLTLALALRDPDPVSPQGVARAWRLITDGGSALYDPEHPGRLSEEVRAATAALHLGPKVDDGSA